MVAGSFDGWKVHHPMTRVGSRGPFTSTIDVSPGKVYYKFIVDGAWTISDASATETDASGNRNNVVEVSDHHETPVMVSPITVQSEEWVEEQQGVGRPAAASVGSDICENLIDVQDTDRSVEVSLKDDNSVVTKYEDTYETLPTPRGGLLSRLRGMFG